MMWINYHHLFYFKTIAEEQSVSRAAEKLRLGQPTLSAQLKQFEEYLNVKLFDRQHKKLILTEQGKLVLHYAQSIFKLGSEMIDSLRDRSQPDRISIQIGALDGIPKEFLTELATKCLAYGNAQLSFSEGSLDYLLRELDAHQVDLVVTNFLPKSKDHKKTFHKLVQKSEIKIYGTSEFKHLRKKFPESLKGQKIILPTYDSQLRFDLDHWFKLRLIDLQVVAESQDIALKKQLALKGFGLVAGTIQSMKTEIESQTLFEIGSLSNVYETIYFLTAERKVVHPLAQHLMKEALATN